MIKFKKSSGGDDRIDYTPDSAVVAGQGIVVGTVLGVATSPIAADEEGTLAITGEFDFDKTDGGGITFDQGAKVYFDEGAQKATSVAAEHLLVGVATEAAADGDSTVAVRLQPQGS